MMYKAYHTETSPKETPVFELSSVTQLPDNTNCLACSGDGQYLCVGHSTGLSLWSASSSFRRIAEWSHDRLEITSIQMTRLAEMAYLLGTIDDMGVARVLLFWSESIHLLNIINTMEDINNRSICLSFELSEGGDYGVASITCNGAIWLEVFHFPLEAWLQESGTAASQRQDSHKWSPVAVINTIKPLHSTSDTLSEKTLQTRFFTHSLALDGERGSPPGHCTVHFLLPLSGESKAKAGLPYALCIWWSGSNNLLQYWLHRATKNKPDLEPLPNVLWPNANEIVCSAVSGCTRYIVLGLSDAVVCVWDRKSGSPLSILSMSGTDHFSRIHFVDYWPVSTDESRSGSEVKLQLLVMCKNGAMYTATIERGFDTRMLQLTERVKDSGDLVTIAASVPFLQGLSLVMQRNGKMFLLDVINKRTVCSLILPPKHMLATPSKPAFALNNIHSTLFIQGDEDPFSKEDCHGHLYIFRFQECDIVKPYIITPTDSARQQKTCSFVTLQDSCNQYLQERVFSTDERIKDIRQTWKKLQDTSAMVQQSFPVNHT